MPINRYLVFVDADEQIVFYGLDDPGTPPAGRTKVTNPPRDPQDGDMWDTGVGYRAATQGEKDNGLAIGYSLTPTKGTPVDADTIIICDSEDSGLEKEQPLSSLPGGSSNLYRSHRHQGADASVAAQEYWPQWEGVAWRTSAPTIANWSYYFTAPHDGEIKRSLIKCLSDPGDTDIRFYADFEATASIVSGTLSFSASPSGGGYYAEHDWSGATFSKGVRLASSVKSATTPMDELVITHVVEYDKST